MCTMWVNNFLVLVSCLVLCHVIAAEPGSPSFDPVVVQVGSQRRSYQEPQAVTHNISIHGDNLLLDGQPYHILSGSLHYFRLPAEYWRDRLRKLRAAGLNTVSTYVEWSFHEPEYRQYSFEGDRDVAAFVRIAGEEGLRVLLRPGPYICAERDLGGFPYWLLGRYPEMRLRTRDKDFMEESKIWLAKLFEQLKPLLFGYGGPIIFVQVENEYGSFGADMDYKVQMRDIYLQHVGAAAVLYTTDGGARDYYSRGYVPGALTTIDFGPGAKVKTAFDNLRQFMPQGPLMNSEYYPGWLTHWGESLQTRSTEAVIRTMREMLQQKIHVNIYVFYGGTNFGFTSGANYNNKYEPVITSYDYDAPLSEAGDPTPKYHALRDLLKEFNYVPKDDSVPTSSPKGAYGPVTVTPRVGLLSAAGRVALGKKYSDVSGANLPSFEQLQQKSGLVLYETTLQSKGDKSLYIQRPRDWIYVYVDGKYKGSLNRMYKRFTLNIESKKNSKLSLLVEDQGRINFGNRIVDRKGILSAVIYDNKTLDGKWEITGYPLEVVDKVDGQVADKPDFSSGPVFFRGSITLPEGQKPMDTFLDTTGWGKGLVWVNGHNLGRYWPGLGPQVTLYVPGVWLNPAPASNVVEILELESAPDEYSMMFIDFPILNRTSNL